MKYIFYGLSILLNLHVSAQKTSYRNLIMEGGGVKGIAYGGALIELENKGILQNIERVGGTSAGAIQACLLAVGYAAEEIAKITNQTPIESFNDGGFITKKTQSLIKEFGWYQGETFLQVLQKLIANRTNKPNLTFAELHDLAQAYPFRDLYVTGTNLSKQKVEVFSYETYPEMRICDAVRVSISIPLYFKAVWLDPKGRIIEKPLRGDSCSLFVDGGLLLGYPISLFDDSKYLKDSEVINASFNTETLGLKFERCPQIDHEIQQKEGVAPYEITDFETYMLALMHVAEHHINKPKPENAKRTIFINDEWMNSRIRKISEEEKLKMMAAGRQAVVEFFLRN